MYIYHFVNNKDIENAGYCGQCINFEKRKQRHFGKHSHCKHFVNAINKYGRDSFEGNIIMEVPDKYADWFEIYWIFTLGCVQYGYNITDGGHNRTPSASTEICHNSKQNQFVKIKCIEDNIIFDCEMDAARYYNISQGSIAKCLGPKAKCLSAGGKHFCYANEYITVKDVECNNKLNKCVRCITDNKAFCKIKDAAIFYNIKDTSNISKAIKRNGTCKNKTFEYITYNEYLSIISAGNGG